MCSVIYSLLLRGKLLFCKMSNQYIFFVFFFFTPSEAEISIFYGKINKQHTPISARGVVRASHLHTLRVCAAAAELKPARCISIRSARKLLEIALLRE